jgi:hypothetical protein
MKESIQAPAAERARLGRAILLQFRTEKLFDRVYRFPDLKQVRSVMEAERSRTKRVSHEFAFKDFFSAFVHCS